jgi:hypothetical protein
MENENYEDHGNNTMLVDEFLKMLKKKYCGGNGNENYEIDEINSTEIEGKISSSIVDSFLKQKKIFKAVKNPCILYESDNNGAANRIEKLYHLFRNLDEDDLQILKADIEVGKFAKIVNLREYLFNEIIGELKSVIIHNKNKYDLYKILSAMNNDYLFKDIFLHYHKAGRKIFEDIYHRLEIGVGNGSLFLNDDGAKETKEKGNDE